MGSSCAFQNLLWIFLFYCLVGDSVEDEDKQVLVTVPSGKVTRRVADDLNLTCKVFSDAKYYISWRIPQNRQLQADRIKLEDGFNTQSVTVYQLQDYDAGVYSCIARHRDRVLTKEIFVSVVQSEPKPCSDHSFPCENGHCIPRRFACDGRMDCNDGSDESKIVCGSDPCKDKVLCEDGRCLPRSFCCDPATDISCQLSFLLPCCKQYLASIATEALFPSKAAGTLPPHRRYSGNVEYLPSSVYTVVSCAVVFIFVATVMVAAICRIHMRRSAMAMFPTHVTPASSTERHRFLPWCSHHPRFSARPSSLNTHPCSHLPFGGNLRTVTCPHGSYVVAAYSSSQGKVHFFQHLPKPPDYSPAADDPPPPYSSTDNLCVAVANESAVGNDEGRKTFTQSVQIPPSLHHLCSATINALADDDNACVAVASASGESSPLLSVTEQSSTSSGAPGHGELSETAVKHVA
ncbi:uncharacterized protein LOC135393783 isoform X2 [Ornithodoros turicata]|uniref:uncharacterized protein LOC135393783 isoform X2 n=1 Tax=Ornithodoros turicata TaxID=34597 RepID=UPI003138E58F